MSKFLITVWPFSGHLFPNIAIAHALANSGHEVAFYTSARVRSEIENQSFICFPFEQLNSRVFEQLVAAGYVHESFPWRRIQKQKSAYQTMLIDTLPGQIADLEAIMSDWNPDVIICDPTMWGPFLIMHELTGVPVAIYCWTLGCMLPGPEAPPPGLGLPPPKQWGTRILSRIIGWFTAAFTCDIRRAANDFREQYELPPLTMPVAAYAGQMPLYLVSSTPALDYERKDLPPSVQYVGPCLWSKGNGKPSWIDNLPTDKPWIYVTEGTLHTRRMSLLKAAVKGLADFPAYVFLTTGGLCEPDELDLGPLPSNILIERWIPDSELIPRTWLVVTAGGASTVLAALQAGVPLIVVPTEWDKPENAQRVVESGAGLRLAPAQCTPQRLRKLVNRVFTEPMFQQQAQALADDFKRYGGTARAVELLENLDAK